jgi:hypothetical protein
MVTAFFAIAVDILLPRPLQVGGTRILSAKVLQFKDYTSKRRPSILPPIVGAGCKDVKMVESSYRHK